ncbi:Immunity protein 26 [Anaerocolumna jejuensis DSM 15929]|uniref:Immunity protein 26 n=1 Tax=Anaerocolumna jejuensis DSM 15929 TaxID=1121322 RepID=A0A1M6LSK2_9FIRM|nr:Imm26 family immunity protein [Anaerocolumna jejuensis]SHJ74187.1 Immunity protein 26 [Anaerocolumna jejuensis DSM 15929]
MKIEEGSIFGIPLFMEKDDWKLKSKLSEKDLDKDFAFGRVIETSSSVLVEIFKKIGSAHTDINEIVNSGIMFSPVQIFWDAISKKRWRIVGRTENYDKFKDSNYNNIEMAFGLDDDFRLRHLSTGKERPISRDELKKYEFSVVWYPIDLEKRILNEQLSI